MIQKFHINAVGNVHLFHAFLPLIQCGNIRKVVAISTGNTDLDMVAEKQIPSGSLYSISKIALNMAVAKFHAQYAKEGILFMAVCPGHVDTGHLDRRKKPLKIWNDDCQLTAYSHSGRESTGRYSGCTIFKVCPAYGSSQGCCTRCAPTYWECRHADKWGSPGVSPRQSPVDMSIQNFISSDRDDEDLLLKMPRAWKEFEALTVLSLLLFALWPNYNQWPFQAPFLLTKSLSWGLKVSLFKYCSCVQVL